MNLDNTAKLVDSFDEVVRSAIDQDMRSLDSKYASPSDYLRDIGTKIKAFDKAAGRQMELKALKNICLNKGSFAHVSGGLSVGKSKLMKILVQNIEEDRMKMNTEAGSPRVVLIHYNDIISCYITLIKGLTKLVGVESTKVSIHLTDFRESPLTALLRELSTCIPEESGHLVLLLERKTNVFLPGRQAADDTVALFQALVDMPEQQRSKMSVVLVSGTDGMPVRLEDKWIDDNTRIPYNMVIGETDPAEMLATLKELGVGEQLRHLLVSVYGGHIWDIRNAVLKLDIKPGRRSMVRWGPASYIKAAFADWEAVGGDRARLVEVLEELARRGFCPLEPTDKIGRLLTKHYLCTYLVEGAVEFFVDPAVRQGRCGVVPSTQLVRVHIPGVLQKLGTSREDEL